MLAVTGTEALYADMGHFGASPIRRACLLFVLPALVLNYFGQGALLIHDSAAIENPFYLLAPEWALFPMVALATCATVIASQAVISGAFSLTRQAIQMGYCPRLTITHTSYREIGQIYVPFVNWTLIAAVMALVAGCRSSSNLTAAYGIAVTLAMAIDSCLIYIVLTRLWRWNPVVALLIVIPLITIDSSFLASNALKIPEGGWFPIVVGAVVFTVLTTRKRGRSMLLQRLARETMPIDAFVAAIAATPPVRVPGTAVFLTSTANRVPHALLHNLKHNKVLHERVVFLTITTREIPIVPLAERVRIDDLGCASWQIEAFFGFKEDPDVPKTARRMRPPRPSLRHDGHVVLRLAGNAHPHRVARDGSLARALVRLDVEERDQGDRVLQRAHQARGRVGNPGGALKRKRRRSRRRSGRSRTRPAKRL